MGLFDANDIDFSWDGDFLIDSTGSLADTSDDWLRSLVNQVRDLVKSEQGDWESDPNFAADLSEFIGEANTREMGKKIEQRIRSRIVNIGLVPTQDLNIRVVPIHVNQLAVFIKISCTPTANNKLVLGEPVIVTFVFDTMEHSIFFTLSNTSTTDPFTS